MRLFIIIVLFAVSQAALSSALSSRLREILQGLKYNVERRGITTPIPPPQTTESSSDDDDDNDDDDVDDNDDKDGKELLHRIRGSCGVVAAYGTHLFSNFPEGPMTDKIKVLTPEDFRQQLVIFKNIERLGSKDKTVYIRGLVDSIGGKLLHYRMECPALKMQQLMIYILRFQLNKEMRDDDGSLRSNLLAILSPVAGDKAEDYAERSVRFIHRFMWEELIDQIMRNELQDLNKLTRQFGKIAKKRINRKSATLDQWLKIIGKVLKKNRNALTCPTRQEILQFHVDLSQKMKERFQNDILEKEIVVAVEEIIRDYFKFPMPDPSPVIRRMLEVFTTYVKSALHYYNIFEEKIKSKTLYDLESLFADILDPKQMEFFRQLMNWLYPDRVPPTLPTR